MNNGENVTMDEGSSRMLTGDSYVTSFSGNLQGIDANGHRHFEDGTEVPWSENFQDFSIHLQ